MKVRIKTLSGGVYQAFGDTLVIAHAFNRLTYMSSDGIIRSLPLTAVHTITFENPNDTK